MNLTFVIVAITVVVALIFDFTNGFHDAANSIATVVSTRVLSPVRAVILAAFFNFIAFFLTTHAVANTVYRGLVDPNQVNEWVVLAGLIGAVAWNLITWYLGLPTSSSHALIAGLFLMTAVFWIFRRVAPSRVDKYFRFMQLISSSAFSFSHGTNDAQKTMGIIMAALVTGKFVDRGSDIPYWVGLAAFMAIGLGTMSGGWRIVKTMGSKITKLKPVGGFCAETGGAGAVLLASHFGIPVSTTHTITGAIVGVGSTRRLSAVRWGVAGRIVWAWVVTIPAAGLIAAVAYYISKLVH